MIAMMMLWISSIIWFSLMMMCWKCLTPMKRKEDIENKYVEKGPNDEPISEKE